HGSDIDENAGVRVDINRWGSCASLALQSFLHEPRPYLVSRLRCPYRTNVAGYGISNRNARTSRDIRQEDLAPRMVQLDLAIQYNWATGTFASCAVPNRLASRHPDHWAPRT